MTIATLIDKQDTAEIIRDQIAALLALETAAQVKLANTAGKSTPSEWKFRVFQERANPWEEVPGVPIVNVWWDNSTFDGAASNIVERQKSSTIYNLDCYGYGRSSDNPAGGHHCGDQSAAEEAQKAVRLVRNILMSAEYTYLGLRGTVWRRWIDSISIFQPQQDNQNVQHVVVARLAFRVEFNEYSPQVVAETLDLLTVDVLRTEDGEIVVEADYDYTA
ncbi:hypothetical protein K0U83_18675 [bacterium]|nr:hypothetical protein [bacterium]